jgi:hypothetical protein
MITTHTQPAGCDLDSLQRFNNRGGLMNPEANGLYVRFEDAARAAQVPQGGTRQGAPAGKWVRCTPNLILAGVDCAHTPRRPGNGTYSHDHFIAHTCTPADERTRREQFVAYWRARFQYSADHAFLDEAGNFCTPSDDPIHMNWKTWNDARAAQGAGTAPVGWALVPADPPLSMAKAFRDADLNGDRFLDGYAAMLRATHPAPVSTAASKSPEFEGIGDAPVSTAAATTASASMPVLNNGTREQQLEAVARGGIDDLMRLHAALGFGEDETIDADKMIERIATLAPSRAADGQQGASPELRAHALKLDAELSTLAQQGASRAALDDDTVDRLHKLREEVAMMYMLLDDGEWAEHLAVTPEGQCLETAITKLVGKANAALARAPLPAQDDARLEVFIDWYLREGNTCRDQSKRPHGAHHPRADSGMVGPCRPVPRPK